MIVTVVVMLSIAAVFVRRRIVHVVMAGMLMLAQLGLHPRTANRAQHGTSHRTPDGKQDGKQQQEPDSDSLQDG